MWRRWGTPQNFCLAYIDELKKQLFIKRLYPPNFFKKNLFLLFDVLWYFKLWRIPLYYLFLLFKTFYASIFHYKIDSLEEYYLATDIATSFTCFKHQYCTRKSSFYLFSMVENPVKLNPVKIWINKTKLSYKNKHWVLACKIDNFQRLSTVATYPMGNICMS